MALLDLGEFLWSLLAIFFMVVYFMMIFYVIVDVFRRPDASGMKKAVWLIFLLVAPLIGLVSYLAANGDKISQRNMERALQSADSYSRMSASGNGTAGEIERGKELLDSGAINEAEFAQLKSKALTQGA